MKRVWVVFVAGLVQVLLLAGAAQAPGASFFDDLLSFDAARWTKEDHCWTKEDHYLGRRYLNPANVDAVDGVARLKIPRNML